MPARRAVGCERRGTGRGAFEQRLSCPKQSGLILACRTLLHVFGAWNHACRAAAAELEAVRDTLPYDRPDACVAAGTENLEGVRPRSTLHRS